MANTGEIGVSDVKYNKVYVEWKIPKFFEQGTCNRYFLQSCNFYLACFCFCLEIKAKNFNSNHRLGLYVRRQKASKFKEGCHVVLHIGIKRNDGSVFNDFKIKTMITLDSVEPGYNFYCERSDLYSSQNDNISENSLTVFCSASIASAKVEQSQISHGFNISHVDPTLTEDFRHLFLDRQRTDITIKVKNKEFFAHKCVLAARSEVFAAMLSHSMAESKRGLIEINDTDPNIFQDFILHLYTGELHRVSPSNALSLYKIAHMYEVTDLREECVRWIVREISVDNFLDLIDLASSHNEPHILRAAKFFFVKNMTAITKLAKWKMFRIENPMTCYELLTKYLDES